MVDEAEAQLPRLGGVAPGIRAAAPSRWISRAATRPRGGLFTRGPSCPMRKYPAEKALFFSC